MSDRLHFIFWHHEPHGPLDLETLWLGTHGFAGSVGGLRVLFWLSQLGHQVTLIGNVRKGSHRGVEAVAGTDVSRILTGDGRKCVLILINPPDKSTWDLACILRDKCAIIYWALSPIPHPVWLERVASGELSRIVCISEYHRNLYRIYRGFRKVEACYVGVDTDLLPKESDITKGQIALFCSVPRRSKGFHNMLAAWPTIRKHVPLARLVVTGSAQMHGSTIPLGKTGILEDDVENEFPDIFADYPRSAEAQGIILLGRLPGINEVYEQMAGARVALVNCNWSGSFEMFCRSAVEAQLVGTPVVGTARGSLTEVVSDGKTGILVRRKSIRALAEAVIALLSNDSLRQSMSDNSRKWAHAFSDYERLANQWVTIALRALSGEPTPNARFSMADLVRVTGLGSIRAKVRNSIRGTWLEQKLFQWMRR